MVNKSVLLLGSYGQSNLGDDLLMWNYLELLKSRGYTDIYVNANTTDHLPRPVRQAYPELQVVDTYNTSVLQYVQLIKKVDCIVYGGGTLYKELYASTGRSKYSVIIRMMGFNILAKLLGTRLYHLNIGIGVIRSRMGRLISKLAIGAATESIFRDKKSYDYAKDVLHIPAAKIKLSTDGLFIDHVWEKPWKAQSLKIDRKKYKNVIGINILSDIPDWIKRDEYIQTMQQFVLERLRAGDYIVFVPFQHAFNPRNDLVFMQEVFGDLLKNKTGYTMLNKVPIDLASSYLRQCDVFMGMRFHSLLLATVNEVPFVAIAYDTKCWRFVTEANYPHAIELEALNLAELNRHYETVLSMKKEAKEKLRLIARQTYDRAEEDIRALSL